MGLVSYQEDNLDAKGEEKKEVPAMVIEELDDLDDLDSGTKVKNTVIIKADGLAINSVEIEDYTFHITFMRDDEQSEPQIDLTATAPAETGKKVFLISQFDDIKEACALLTALMLAIENQEAVFNVSATHIKSPQIDDFNEIRNAFREYVKRESTILQYDGISKDPAFVRYKTGIPNPNGNGLPPIWINAWIPDNHGKISAAISVDRNSPFLASHYQELKENKSKIEAAFSFDTTIEIAELVSGIHQFRINKAGVDLTQTANWETEFRWLRENLEKLYWVLQIQDIGNGWDAL